MLKEIHKAVETFHKIAFGTKHNANKLPENKLAAFVTILTELLTARYEKNWYPENPVRGSGYRCIRVNGQSIDPTIVECLKRANIDLKKGLICTEVTIWVDPGVVSMRIGEDGSIGSEIVDEETYNMSKQVKETAQKSFGAESDEGFSSRSSSPESSSSERSWSSSPSMSSSPVPSKFAASPLPSAIEFNQYTPHSHVTYPNVYQGTGTPSQHGHRNSAVPHFQSQGGRSHISFGPAMMSTPNGDPLGQQGHIPASSAHRTSYTRPRALFPAQDNSNSSKTTREGLSKIAFNQYQGLPMMYAGNLQQTSFLDIPAMA